MPKTYWKVWHSFWAKSKLCLKLGIQRTFMSKKLGKREMVPVWVIFTLYELGNLTIKGLNKRMSNTKTIRIKSYMLIGPWINNPRFRIWIINQITRGYMVKNTPASWHWLLIQQIFLFKCVSREEQDERTELERVVKKNYYS